jgi:hypothetical protein
MRSISSGSWNTPKEWAEKNEDAKGQEAKLRLGTTRARKVLEKDTKNASKRAKKKAPKGYKGL